VLYAEETAGTQAWMLQEVQAMLQLRGLFEGAAVMSCGWLWMAKFAAWVKQHQG
jgi:hypothetical protein